MKIATLEESRTADQLAVRKFGISERQLVERAGIGCGRLIRQRFPASGRIVGITGKGKNGQDGKVALEWLGRQGCRVRELSASALPSDWRQTLRKADLVIDALFGIGLDRPVRGIERELIEAVNQSDKKVVSLDIPSGIHADSGRVLGVAVAADLTCTMGLPKLGLLIGNGPDHSGEVVTIDIGIPPAAYQEIGIRGSWIAPSQFAERVRPRRLDTHKGTYGHLLVVGGSVNRLGAPLLTARAALRSGAGLVTVALPDRCYQKIPRGLLEVMYEPMPSGPLGRLSAAAAKPLSELARDKGCLAIGPGLGTTPEIRRIVTALVRGRKLPCVIDADALTVLGPKIELLRESRFPVILTPHPGEMGRLIGKDAAGVQADRLGAATRVAEKGHCFVVLKGFRTLVVCPDGRYFVNPTGNPGMATAGMGDVLTGIIGALMAEKGTDPLTAILAAVYLHGRAGDRVRERLGDRGLLASDVVEEIPHAFKELLR